MTTAPLFLLLPLVFCVAQWLHKVCVIQAVGSHLPAVVRNRFIDSDARGVLENQLVDRHTYSSTERAISRVRTPPMEIKLGGDICIRGGVAQIIG